MIVLTHGCAVISHQRVIALADNNDWTMKSMQRNCEPTCGPQKAHWALNKGPVETSHMLQGPCIRALWYCTLGHKHVSSDVYGVHLSLS